MDFNVLISRIQGIFLKPQDEWKKIKGEPTTINKLYLSYIVILSAIPAVAGFIGSALMGSRIPYLGASLIGKFLIGWILSYILGLAAVYGAAMIITMLAPSFNSKPDMVMSLKLVAYGMTPYWVAGILHIIPIYGLWTIGWLIGLYSFYILYLGFASPLLDTPKDKTVPFMVISCIAILIIIGLLSWIPMALVGLGGVGFFRF
jgi:hypothetical protein